MTDALPEPPDDSYDPVAAIRTTHLLIQYHERRIKTLRDNLRAHIHCARTILGYSYVRLSKEVGTISPTHLHTLANKGKPAPTTQTRRKNQPPWHVNIR